jgi:uncharacterized membrane protein YraQ (UPF0718 family)
MAATTKHLTRKADSSRPAIAMIVLVVAGVAGRSRIVDLLDSSQSQFWATVFVAICIQAMPFLVLGVALSGLISGFVKPTMLSKVLPRRTSLAIPVAAFGGIVLPGCECSSVPVSARLTERGVPLPVALTFLLASPAINPVVLIATAVAFPNRPLLVVARFVASVVTAMFVGWIWLRIGKAEWLLERWQTAHDHHHEHGWRVAVNAALHDFAHAGGYLVIGAAAAATLQTIVPRSILDRLGSNYFVAILAMGLLAILLSICSEADAFVATGLTSFSLSARLTFLVVGPMVDLKLVALQAGTFGRQFAMRFAPLTFVVALLVSAAVGVVL